MIIDSQYIPIYSGVMKTFTVVGPVPIMPELLIVQIEHKFSEQELIADLRIGVTKSHETLYEMYAGSLYGIIFRFVKRQEDAEDILQETFIKIWKSIRTYDSEKGRLFTWMSKIAKNVAKDHLKSRSHKKSVLNNNLDTCQIAIEKQHRVESNYDTIGIKEITNKLPLRFYSILDLIYFKGFTHKEAAIELNLPLGTIKTRLRMAIEDLRKRV